jgi:peptidoglycan/LPS O-acetylase OafA/YrhL
MSGPYAVFCFYLVSGYLMCLILNEVYVGTENTLKYLANRALRIYPPYIAVLLLTFITISAVPELMGDIAFDTLIFRDVLSQPGNAEQWLANISLLYAPSELLAVSQAWSLRVELVYYVAMIFLVRHQSLVVVWCALSIAYVVYLEYLDASFWQRYATILGASIAFSLGALIYHLHKKYKLGALHLPIAATLYFLHLSLAQRIWGNGSEGLIMLSFRETYGIYTNLLLAGYLLYAIICTEERPGSFFKLGKTLGDIAYAIFLVHWVVAIGLIAAGVPFENKQYFVPVSFLALNLTAIALYLLVEKPVNVHFRDKIRNL